MPKNNQDGNAAGNRTQGGNRGPEGGRPRGGNEGRGPQAGAKQPTLEEALDTMLMQDWFRSGVAEMLASLLESNTPPPDVRDWLRHQLSGLLEEGGEERREILEGWAEDASQMQEMMRDFQGQYQELQKLISGEQRQFDALTSRLHKLANAQATSSVAARASRPVPGLGLAQTAPPAHSAAAYLAYARSGPRSGRR